LNSPNIPLLTDDYSNVLIIGSGGREHALGWKLSQSPHVKRVYFAPGNGGTYENIDLQSLEFDDLSSFAKEHRCFTIVGGEVPLAEGIVDSFEKEDVMIFGPTKQAAQLESSKDFAKTFMKKYRIPTANYCTFSDPDKAKDYVNKQSTKLVIKADGLASGKGVILCDNANEATEAIETIMTKRKFGSAGNRVIIEERLFGEEASFIALSDGETILPLASTQDHKRISDNDKGENTGGMGSYSPTPIIDDDLTEKIIKKIMSPAVSAMRSENNTFKGFLYAGIMIDRVSNEPSVLEFNVRMGDPECQPLMMRMNSDLFDYLKAAYEGRLDSMSPLKWKEQFAVCVVMASKGYPGNYQIGDLIRGLNSEIGDNTMIFHGGTKRDSQNRIITNGGRVLGVTSLGYNMEQATKNAYSAVQKISWGENGQYYRNDIAMKALRF
jgi:phosphoribosylamine---glycine ligase